VTAHGLTLRHNDHKGHKDHKRSLVFVLFAASVIAGIGRCSAQGTTTAPRFDGARAFADLKAMVAIGPRPAGSPAIEKTRDYIRKELAAAGLKAEDQPFDAQTPTGKVHMVNIRATLPGQIHDKGRIVIGGHYDTKLFTDISFVGASDAASSAAFLLEMARALKGRQNPLPIELLFLDGEEAVVDWTGTDHTYGSRYYVQQAKAAGTTKEIRAFILVDMIGDKDLNIRREQNSTPWLTDAIWSTAKKLNRPEFLDDASPIEDDHLEFLEAGIESVDIIDLDYPAWHKATDDLAHVSVKSLQAVGDVVVAALPLIETRLK
jgi:Zn-dependent M28 family amino/carboxypeptidase